MITKMIKKHGKKHTIKLGMWNSSAYEPTPTIIEAAQNLYYKHNVRDITTSGADQINLGITTEAILRAIYCAVNKNKKSLFSLQGFRDLEKL